MSIEFFFNYSNNIILSYNTIHNLKDDCFRACIYAGISTNKSVDIGKNLGDSGPTASATKGASKKKGVSSMSMKSMGRNLARVANQK